MTVTEAAAVTVVNEEYKEIRVDRIDPHPSNPNVGDEGAIEESMLANGFYGAIVVRRKGDKRYELIAGEHRWRVAARNGVKRIPAVVVAMDDVAAVRAMLADNETARRGRYKPDVLAQTLASLGDVKGTGFDLEDLGRFEDQREEAGRPAPTDDGGAPDPGKTFVREYGVVVTFESEADQQGFYDWLVANGGLEAHQIRVTSI